MRAVFADSFYYLAVLNADNAAHDRAVALSESLAVPVVTTAWVLTEVADALSAPAHRGGFLSLLDAIRGDPDTTIVPPSEAVFEAGVTLYARRLDKDWSLTDCISFAVMEDMRLDEALAADRHFEQAGFVALLK